MWIDVVDPATEEKIGRVAHAKRADLDAALAAVQRTAPEWAAVSAYDRAKIMRKAANLMRERADRIAWIMSREQGKPMPEARMETMAGADVIDWFAEEAQRAWRDADGDQAAGRSRSGPG